MRAFSLLLVFTLVSVCLGDEPKPASTPQAKEPTYYGRNARRVANRDERQRPGSAKWGR